MHRLLIALSLLAATPALAGCIDATSGIVPECETLDVATFIPSNGSAASVDRAPGEPVPVMVWATNVAPVSLAVDARLEPAGRAVASSFPMDDDPLDAGVLGPGERWFLAVELDADRADGNLSLKIGTDAVGVEADAREIACEYNVTHEREFEPSEPTDAPRGEAGKGVLVHTVGWWENGTSFYTNHQGYHDADFPQGYLGPYEGSEPLKVYVYNESREEMPERYNESGYVTTIPGFNEALKGIPTVGGRVAYLEPDEAYTREGYEEHPLYGDPLVFYIEAVEVRSVPCEVPQPVCMPPDEGDIPPGPLGR